MKQTAAGPRKGIFGAVKMRLPAKMIDMGDGHVLLSEEVTGNDFLCPKIRVSRKIPAEHLAQSQQ